jgi:simple sugar transport system ATP-binding protein
MARLGITRVKNSKQAAGTLSGGERQALAIARAVHFGARVLLLDEPTAALGVRESEIVLRVINSVRSQGVAVMFVTHNPYHAHEQGDHFVVLLRGESTGVHRKEDLSVGELMFLMGGGRGRGSAYEPPR